MLKWIIRFICNAYMSFGLTEERNNLLFDDNLEQP